MVLVQGWAVDPVGISRIDLIVDGQFVHSANLSLPRTDIIDSHPDWGGTQNRLPGFQTGFSAARYSNGTHTVMVRIFTEDNQVYEVGQRTVFIDNTINQPPFGFVENPGTTAVYDVNGSFPVSGWAADVDGIARIDVQIDNLSTQAAVYGDPRPDVQNSFPDLPSTLYSGFLAQLDSSRLTDGVHSLNVRATDRNGLSRVIGRRTIQVFNSENNLRPFGSLDQPQRDAVLYGDCGDTGPVVSPLIDPENRITPVRGWALDLGTREDTGRVAYAELMIDGVQWYSTDDCRFDSTFGAYVDCYGLPRPDVAKYYPTHPDSPRAGYFFAMDVGSLVSLAGLREGPHVLKVRVGDQEQTFSELPGTAGIPVFFSCIRGSLFAPFGYIDFPHNFDHVKGTVQFLGWALPQVQTVEISIDGVVAGLAEYGFLRTDVQAAYPTFTSAALRSGWRFNMDTTQLSDGRHRMTVTALSTSGGQRAEIGSVDFYVDNANQ
ncbi:MAG: Ig-like domain-containing protein [Acidobacteria bacterium]|nr:Ig-like domain-containing protein [Acidobacteriota bacterium]